MVQRSLVHVGVVSESEGLARRAGRGTTPAGEPYATRGRGHFEDLPEWRRRRGRGRGTRRDPRGGKRVEEDASSKMNSRTHAAEMRAMCAALLELPKYALVVGDVERGRPRARRPWRDAPSGRTRSSSDGRRGRGRVLTAVDVGANDSAHCSPKRSSRGNACYRDLVERHSLEGARALRHRQVAPVQPIQDAPLTFHRQILSETRASVIPPRPPRGTHCGCEEDDLTKRQALPRPPRGPKKYGARRYRSFFPLCALFFGWSVISRKFFSLFISRALIAVSVYPVIRRDLTDFCRSRERDITINLSKFPMKNGPSAHPIGVPQ